MELSQDEPTRRLAEAREKARRDEYARRKYAHQEGLQQGLQQGFQQGRQEERVYIARTLLREKDPAEKVAKVTGLSLTEVQALAQEIEISH
jgi:predicted transposase/invertase (TIGR01784 family)